MDIITKTTKDRIISGITGSTTKTGLIPSYSTNCLLCDSCLKRQADPDPLNVCRYCYSKKILKLRPTLYEKTKRNTDLACGQAWTAADIPILTGRFFRLESFGEIQNTQQVQNYFLLAAKNPATVINLFTKNADIVKATDIKKPDNLRVVYSVQQINKELTPDELSAIINEYPFIDSVFRVVTKGRINKEKNTCGGFCPSCMKCFKAGPLQVITEGLRK